MHLRHISPRSSDWKDAMDEGDGGRGWERLAPEEREKLLQERRDDDGDLKSEPMTGSADVGSALDACESARRRHEIDGRLWWCRVAFEVGDEDLRRAILSATGLGRARGVVHDDREHERRVAR